MRAFRRHAAPENRDACKVPVDSLSLLSFLGILHTYICCMMCVGAIQRRWSTESFFFLSSKGSRFRQCWRSTGWKRERSVVIGWRNGGVLDSGQSEWQLLGGRASWNLPEAWERNVELAREYLKLKRSVARWKLFVFFLGIRGRGERFLRIVLVFLLLFYYDGACYGCS